MKVTCESCGSKYTIKDDKVRGKRVKIRCKGCKSPIVVDGLSIDGSSATSDSEDAPAYSDVPDAPDETGLASAQAAFPGTPWETNFEIDGNTVVDGPTPPAGGAGVDWDNGDGFLQDFGDPLDVCGNVTDPTSVGGKLDDFDPFAPNPIPAQVLNKGDLCQAYIGWELKNVEAAQWAMALKGASEELKNKILGNMSQRASQMLREEMEFLGAVRLSEVEAVQQQIVDIVRRLEDSGELTVNTGSEEEAFIQ